MDFHLSPEHYRSVFEAMPGAFLLLRPDSDFTIAAVSDEYLRATLTERAQILGRPVFKVFPDNPGTPEANSTNNLSRSLQQVVATRTTDIMPVQRYDVPTADGVGFEMRYWAPTNAPVLAPDGELLYIVHRVDNITEYMRLTEENALQRSVSEKLSVDNVKMEAEIVERSHELARLNTELRGANIALSAYADRAREDARRKDEFLAMLAHELRNPLAAISSALQLWTVGGIDERRQHRLVEICRRQVHNLTRMVNDLLEMSRIDRGAVELQRELVDLRDVLENALHASRELFERRQVTLATRIVPADFMAFADATRLEQALSNLLTNAVKYSELGGNVNVGLEHMVSETGTWARFEIEDEGRGIPPDKLDAIFDIFVQVDVSLDRSRGGLGIGLALVRAIVELHGGRVYAYSAGIGHGSRFTVELPLSSLEKNRQGLDNLERSDFASVPQASDLMRRIVLVEDNPDAREMMEALLAAFGYSVLSAASGDKGLELIIDTLPEVAIIDLGLPGLDGFEVAQRVRAEVGTGIRLVAMTGYSSPEVRRAAVEAGFDIHMTKPCTLKQLAEVLSN